MTILFCIVMGCFQLGAAGDHVKSISEARVAGNLAFEVIDHTPSIVGNDESAKKVDRETCKGRIEFKDVNFTYPTRQELQVLKKFTCVFEEGKTTALVGPSGSGKSTIIQLLERFYDPTSGTVEFDGEDFKSLNLKSLR